MSAKFRPILSLEIRGLGRREFDNWQAVSDWTSSELVVWEPWMRSRFRHIEGWRDECIIPLFELKSIADDTISNRIPTDAEEKINTIVESFKSGPAIVTESIPGQHVLWYLDAGKFVEAAIYAGVFVNHKPFNFHEMASEPYDFVVPLIGVVARESTSEPSRDEAGAGSMTIFRAAVQTFAESADKRLQSFDHEAENLDRRIRGMSVRTQQVWEIIRKAADDATARRSALEETYETKLRLAAPASYWRDRARSAQHASYWAIGSFVALLGTVTALGIYFGPSLKAFLADKDGKLEIAAVALLAPVVIILLWLFRIVARSHMLNQQHAMECRQRETMMSTFLALTNDQSGKITEAERLIVLQALFRPSGARSDDEALPSNILEAGLNALKNSKS